MCQYGAFVYRATQGEHIQNTIHICYIVLFLHRNISIECTYVKFTFFLSIYLTAYNIYISYLFIYLYNGIVFLVNAHLLSEGL